MALWPLKKRHVAPFSTTFLMIFAVFFCELPRQDANWREKSPESAGFEPRSIAHLEYAAEPLPAGVERYEGASAADAASLPSNLHPCRWPRLRAFSKRSLLADRGDPLDLVRLESQRHWA
jgi:hypothetical protein